MTPERKARIEQVCRARQGDLAVVLENVHDAHNISAVLRSCDAVGVQSVYVVYTDPGLTEERLRLGRKSSASAWKWVDVHFYDQLDECMQVVKEKYQRVVATHVGRDSQPMHSLDYTGPVALLFGNEKDGVSEDALQYADDQIVIPQVGMIRSLNISVACAVTLYEVMRQRSELGLYRDNPSRSSGDLASLIEDFTQRHESRNKRKTVTRK